MVTTHKISAELYDNTYKLIALHSGLTSYTMAYNINKVVNIKLKRCFEDLDVAQIDFPIYEWRDEVTETTWTLLGNTIKIEEQSESYGLFQDKTNIRTHHLIEERKEVDYFLKIETEEESVLSQTVQLLKSIPQIVTAYSIESEALKSKRNLIF
ncbi:MAG: IPExxxVDY family protein [Croceitalea sp.]|nr:IPExxxVDY family protein [Croceitalea sp.]MBT8238538.1 IPExxxVDY family protein [Croceitalea sp.]NNC35374.1 IPExxxVDY family protein [Croceitalea sp.]NNL08182.1 IPExxxVDY family protein [Croceitalea sp.]NNM17013.1 IPExxxVDY family protein [Croceitalea sp.]